MFYAVCGRKSHSDNCVPGWRDVLLWDIQGRVCPVSYLLNWTNVPIYVKTISGLWSFKAIFANQKHFDHLKLYEITELPDNVFLVFGCFFVNQLMMTPRTFKSISWTEYPQLTIYSQFSLFTLLMWKPLHWKLMLLIVLWFRIKLSSSPNIVIWKQLYEVFIRAA